LVAISGPLKDAVFPLAEEVVSVGRETSNQLCVEDSSVSQRHCRIGAQSNRYTISDLDSLTGTFVNGVPVKERLLTHGDRIAIGNAVFLFLLEGDNAPQPCPVQLDEDTFVSESSKQLRTEEVLYLQPEKLAALPPAARLARDLNVLLKISTAIGSIRWLESLQWQLLGMIFDVVPAERGALLLIGDNAEEFTSVVAWDRISGPHHPVHVGRPLAQHVRRSAPRGLSPC
jgi:Nif-specific regulatory protein